MAHMNPRFMRYKDNLDKLHWGRVNKDCDDGNEIELDHNLVKVILAASEDFNHFHWVFSF